jgi:hypothetical protein
MRVCYAPQPLPSFESETSIFLVGPTPREAAVPSWRPEALSILERLGFQGTVLVPEPQDGNWPKSFLEQVEWEHQGLEAASTLGCVAAWVPRELEKMPGFTTNVEFGLYVGCGRFVYGRPQGAPHTGYLDWLYTLKTSRSPLDRLEDLMRAAIAVAKG